MSLYTTILSDWTAAMKAMDSVRSLALANIKAALLSRAIELGCRQNGLNDEQTTSVLLKLQKQGGDAIASIPGESALKVKEQGELSIINSYLPKRLSAEEVRQKVYEILNSSGIKDLGAGMKVCLPALKSVADGKQIQLYVKQFIEEGDK
jgi:hypothetical protein